MASKQTMISLALLASICFVALVLLFSFHGQTNKVMVEETKPDAFMEEVVAIVLDKQGKPKMKIIAPKMVYFSKNNQTHLTTPQLTIYRKSPTPWYVSANSAIATDGTEYVQFQDNVMIQHAADHQNPATIIKTTTLLVRPNLQTAETNDPITLIQPNVKINGVGMQADMSQGDIKLLSEARGEYVPS